MDEINLMPQEMKPSGVIIKLSGTLKRIALLGVIILFVSVAVYYGAFFFLGNRISAVLTNQDSLKNQIKALEKTEQRLVLIKDRLDKISLISKYPNAVGEVERLKVLSNLFPQGAYIEEIGLSENNLAVSVSAENLDIVSSYLAAVSSPGTYNRVNLSFLEFDLKSGYGVGLTFPE